MEVLENWELNFSLNLNLNLEDRISSASGSPHSSSTPESVPTSPYIGKLIKDFRGIRVSPNKSHDSGYSDSEEGGRSFLEDRLLSEDGGRSYLEDRLLSEEDGLSYTEDRLLTEDLERGYLNVPLNQGLLDINRIKFSLKQLECDYLLFEQERRNFFYLQDEQHSLQELLRGEQFFHRKQSIRELRKEVCRVTVNPEEQLRQEQSFPEQLSAEPAEHIQESLDLKTVKQEDLILNDELKKDVPSILCKQNDFFYSQNRH